MRTLAFCKTIDTNTMHVCDMTVTYLRGGLSACSVVWLAVKFFFLKFTKV